MNKKILVVDDKKNTLKVLSAILNDEGYDVATASNGEQAMSIYEKQKDIDAVLADLKMPGMDGLELYHNLRTMKTEIPFIIMTAHGSIESAVAAMKEGISNYLIKPLNYDELTLVLERAIREKRMSDELADLRRDIRQKYSSKNIIGTHPKMIKVFELLASVAPTDASVLIQGETGTGKELMARAIHSASNRFNRPMICINSAALTDNLLEAELFGYVQGAFTGALTDKKGRLEAADGGTLFLDEIGYMTINLQTKLLRFLQEGSYEPVGGNTTRYVDVRVIAASNKDLNEEIKAKRFLNDLFYRLEVFTITLPPLRERGDDIILLANHFIRVFAKDYQKDIDGIEPEALDLLTRYHWPGNVRELKNCLARGVILAPKRIISVDDLPSKLKTDADKDSSDYPDGYIREIPEEGLSIKDLERELICKTLSKCLGNKSKTADLLGLSRKALYEKIVRYQIDV